MTQIFRWKHFLLTIKNLTILSFTPSNSLAMVTEDHSKKNPVDSYLLKVYNRIIRELIRSQSVKQIGPTILMISISRLIYDGLWSEADPGNLHYLICRHPLYNCPPTEHVSTQGQGTALTSHSTNTCDHGQSRGILLISAMHDSVVKISTIWDMYEKVWNCVCALKSLAAEWLWVMATFLTSSIIDIPVSLLWPFLQWHWPTLMLNLES